MSTNFGTLGLSQRRYDLKRDKPDARDMMYKKVDMGSLPSIVDMRNICPPVEDQGNLGSCTAHGILSLLEFLELREFREGQKNQPQEFAGQGFQRMSRLFLYYNERFLEGTIGEDSGAMIRDGVKALALYGVCNENLWPYDITRFADNPPYECAVQAAKHKITQYQRLNSVDDIRNCLAQRFPVVIGFTVFQSFESQYVAQTGLMQMPMWNEQALGGHCVSIVGYDDSTQRFIVRNSWGTGWGAQGYFYMPYAYIANRSLSQDFWTIRR